MLEISSSRPRPVWQREGRPGNHHHQNTFKLLQCDEDDLFTEEACCHIELFGPGKLEQLEDEQNPFLQVALQHIYSSTEIYISWISCGIHWLRWWRVLSSWPLCSPMVKENLQIGYCAPSIGELDISFYEECNAINVVKALMDSLAPKAKDILHWTNVGPQHHTGLLRLPSCSHYVFCWWLY